MKKSNIQIIVSSVRAGRLCPIIASWIADIGRDCQGLGDLSLLDLADWLLPMNDEPDVPAHGKPYRQEHTRAWSKTITETSALIIVTPQYNWGYPASLKNAMDHLCKEWEGKPLLIVSYGGQGGTKAARQLRQVAECLKMRPVVTEPALSLPKNVISGTAQLDPATAFADDRELVRRGLTELASMLATPLVVAARQEK